MYRCTGIWNRVGGLCLTPSVHYVVSCHGDNTVHVDDINGVRFVLNQHT
jgi:hypothetical protein